MSTYPPSQLQTGDQTLTLMAGFIGVVMLVASAKKIIDTIMYESRLEEKRKRRG